jgi:hypothetical protein
MAESVEILIAADDKASPKLKAVSNNVATLGESVKATGGKVKASTELVGTFANTLGGTQLGGFAGQLAQLTERVSAFSEVSKAGGIGALAFKAGLVAAAGVVTYKVAESIASWFYETERWKKELEAAGKEAQSLEGQFDKVRSRRFGQDREDFSLIRDPVERESAVNARAAELEKQVADLNERIKAEREAAAKKQREVGFFGITQEEADTATAQVESTQRIRDAIDEEAQALREMVGERAKSIEARKAENAAEDKSEAFIEGLRKEIEMLRATKEEQLALEAARNTVPRDSGLAEQLLREREALKAKAEAQKEAENAADLAAKKEAAALERIAELERQSLVNLQAKQIELTKGKEAARAFRLEQEGLAKDVAQDIAKREAELKKIEDAPSREVDKSPQQAVQGRLLTKGTGGDVATQTLNAIKSLVKVAQQAARDEELYRRQKDRGFTVRQVVVP